MATNPDVIKATTQEHLDIYTIKDHLVVLKDGSVALVLKINAINFSLLSEEEQDSLVYTYAALLNSLTFQVQILIRSSKKDISSYLDLIDTHLEKTSSQKIKEQIVKYRGFVKSLVKRNKVLEKKFYIIIPYTDLGINSLKKNLNPFAKAPQKPSQEMDYLMQKAKTELFPRRDHLIRQLSRLGLKSAQLNTQELVTLFYRIYNPNATGVEQFLTIPEDYETPVVQTLAYKPENIPQTQTPPKPGMQIPPTQPPQAQVVSPNLSQVSTPLIPNPIITPSTQTLNTTTTPTPTPIPAPNPTPQVQPINPVTPVTLPKPNFPLPPTQAFNPISSPSTPQNPQNLTNNPPKI